MNEQEHGPEGTGGPKEVGNRLTRTVAWFAVAAGVELSPKVGASERVIEGRAEAS